MYSLNTGKNRFAISIKFAKLFKLKVEKIFQNFIKDLLRNASGKFSGFSRIFLEIIDFKNFREFGNISDGFRWVERCPGSIEKFSEI